MVFQVKKENEIWFEYYFVTENIGGKNARD